MVRRALIVVALVAAVLAAPSRAAGPPGIGTNITHLANISWGAPDGTDLEFASIGGREYAFAGTYHGGLQVVDITNPARPVRVSSYGCGIAQGDVQVFRRDGRTYVAYTSDDGYGRVNAATACFIDAKVRTSLYGTFIIDVTDPRTPRAIGFAPVGVGSHNATVHPSGRYLYSSNADLDVAIGTLEIVDLGDLRKPRGVATVDLGTGLSAHDVTFAADGTRAYVAAITHTLILDTTDPVAPVIVGRILDPAVNISHGAEPFTKDDPVLGRRTYLIVADELAGAAGNHACPGGGLHVYDITGPLELAPVKIGVYFAPDIRPTDGASIVCTAHVMQVHPAEQLMTIAWYAAGVHVLDLSGLRAGGTNTNPGEQLGGGIRAVGSYRFADAETWAAKTNGIAPDGSFHLYANDVRRGFDVYRYVPALAADPVVAAGEWLPPDTATGLGAAIPGYRPTCLLSAR